MLPAAAVVPRTRRRVVVAAVGAVLCLALAPGTAPAGKGVVSAVGTSGSGDAQFANAGAVAVNRSSGDVYVVDQGNNRVEQLDAAGAFVRAWGFGVADGSGAFQTCTSGCQAGVAGAGDGQFDNPQGVAVDQSDGSVYVVDANNGRVEKFDASGGYTSQFGTAGSGNGQLSGPQGIAVDPTDGSLYVADTGDHRVEKFSSAGVYQSQFGAEGSGDGQFEGPTRVAVDSTGRIYVLDSGNTRIERFTSAGAFDQVFDPTDVFFPSEIAIGPASDDLYVAQQAQDFSEQRVAEIDAGGTLVATHGVGSGTSNASGLALSASSQRIYLADGFNTRVFVLDDLTPPTVTLDPPAGVTSTGASVSGTVNPNGSPAVSWRFETSTDDASWTAVGSDQDAGSGGSAVPVGEALTGLVPNTTYFVRLVATRPFNAAAITPELQFTTDAVTPDVLTQSADDVALTHTTFQGVVNPRHSPTTYYFEYGTTTSYGTSVPPSQDVDAGSFDFTGGASHRIDGLTPGTTYHYRLVAHNQAGTVHGQDQVFTTTLPPPASAPRAGIPGSPFLLDGRGWEQVSSAVKNGNDVLADSARTRAASDGGALAFASLGGFGDVRGSGVSTEYMSVRAGQPGTSGWSTHAITPPQDPLTFLGAIQSLEPGYQGEFSADLSKGVFRAWSPLTDAPNVAAVINLYVRNDLRAPGSGFYQLLTDCLPCGTTPLSPIFATRQTPRFAGASADFGHLLVESVYPITADAPPQTFTPNLYEWDHGTVRLAAVLPDGTAAPSSGAGQGAFHGGGIYTPHTISADGSHIFFTDNSPTGGGQDGVLYVRIDHSLTLQVNASERTDCADHQPCSGSAEPDPSASNPPIAKFWTASTDGSRVFFTTSERLTDDDANSAVDVYLFDVNAPVGQRLTRVSIDHEPADGEGSVRGVIGASDDGHYVYFVADGQSVVGEPVNLAGPGIYLWHDGVVSYVGELADPATDTAEDLPGTAFAAAPLAARVTPDGRNLLFTSHSGAGLTGYDHGACRGVVGGCAELYLFSATTRRLYCVSCSPGGEPATADARFIVRERTSGAGTSSHLNHPISDDGQRVFFSTAQGLVSQDANGKRDVYEYDVPSATLHLVSRGTDQADSFFMDASASGNDVFFLTRQQLVGWDIDQNYDLYDARVGGGLPDPVPAPPACSGDQCQGTPSGAPSASTPGTAGAGGSGNVKSAAKPKPKATPKRVRCKRGLVRKRVHGKVRCVKKPKKHRAVKKTASPARGRRSAK